MAKLFKGYFLSGTLIGCCFGELRLKQQQNHRFYTSYCGAVWQICGNIS